MIRLEGVSKAFRLRAEWKVILDDVSLTLPSGRALALLGRNGAGKTTLLQMISGTTQPDRGRVVTMGAVSWPVGFGGSLHGDLTGAQNTRFIARIYGVETAELLEFVEDFAELGGHFHMPIRSYSAGMKSRLGFAMSMGIPFDTYLVDEVTAVGDAAFRRKSKAVFRERIRSASAIMVSHNLAELRDYCDAALLLEAGELRYFPDLNEAIAIHKAMLA
ncbi:ABC transporter ATP-binding protein [Rhodophyticola sp. SM2404]